MQVNDSISEHFSPLTSENSDVDVANDSPDVEMATVDVVSPETPTISFLPSLVPPLLALIHPVPLSFPPLAAPSPHPPTASVLSAIHISALECLNNIFLSLATSQNPPVAADKYGGLKIWDEVWSALSTVGMDSGPGQERRHQMWEIGVGVLWGIGNIWKGTLVSNTNKNTQCRWITHQTSRYLRKTKSRF